MSNQSTNYFKLLKRISFDQKERTKWQEGFDCLFGLNLLTLRGPYSRPSLFIQLGVLPINIAINYLLQLLCFLHFLGRKNVFTCSLACLLACLLSKLSDVTNTHHKLFFSFFHSLYNFTPSLSLLKSLPNRRPVILMGRCLADVSNFDNPKPHASSVTRS